MILVSYSWALPFFLAAHAMTSRAWATVMSVAFSLFTMKETPSNCPSLLRMTLANTGGPPRALFSLDEVTLVDGFHAAHMEDWRTAATTWSRTWLARSAPAPSATTSWWAWTTNARWSAPAASWRAWCTMASLSSSPTTARRRCRPRMTTTRATRARCAPRRCSPRTACRSENAGCCRARCAISAAAKWRAQGAVVCRDTEYCRLGGAAARRRTLQALAASVAVRELRHLLAPPKPS